MKLQIQTGSIKQLLSADVINIREMRLSGEEQEEAFNQLVKVIAEQASQLATRPATIGAPEVKLFAERLGGLAREMDSPDEGKAKGKHNVPKLLEAIRGCFGDVTDIILNAVKLMQIVGPP